MFSEIVKFMLQVDRAGLNRMFQTLNQRFASVAKKFGEGMKNAMKFGGIIGIAGSLIARLLNPLQKAEELIDRIISKGDDAVTNAEEFGTDPGKLLRLEAVAASKGVDSQTLRQLLGKFQSALAGEQEIQAAPERLRKELETAAPEERQGLLVQIAAAEKTAAKGGLLNEFVGETDMADAFFKFIQSIQGLDKSRQTVVQNQIFGEKVRGKAAELFNSKDFAEILAKLPSSEALGTAAVKSGKVADEKDLLTAIRESEDFINKSKLVDESQVQAIDQSERKKNQADDETLKRFDSLKSSSIAIQELTHKFDKFATDFITTVAPQLVNGVNNVSKFAEEFLPSFQELKGVVTTGIDLGLEAAAKVSVAVDGLITSGAEVFGTVADKFTGVVTDIEGVWAEFKSSRIYRTFGGGK